MAEDSGQERTEEATAKRRHDARKKGTVAKSSDLTNSIALFAAVLAAPMIFRSLVVGFQQCITDGISQANDYISFAHIERAVIMAVSPIAIPLLSLVMLLMALGLSVSTAQVGFTLSAESMTPSWEKINPLQGFKRLFSTALIFEAGKAFAKSLVFALLAYAVIASSWGKIMALGFLSPIASLQVGQGIIQVVALRIVFLWLIISGFDYYYQKKRIDKQLRMTEEEVKREMKEMEQSPELKMAFAMKRRKMAKGRMMQSVKTADAIITNPTHYAIAVSYDPKKHTAPLVVAKGADFLAAKIREIAEENEVPIVPNPPLARALYRQCEVGDPIPRDLFQPVAEVLAYVYKTLDKYRQRKVA